MSNEDAKEAIEIDLLEQAKWLIGVHEENNFSGTVTDIAKAFVEAVMFIKGLKDLDPQIVTFERELVLNDVMYNRVTQTVRVMAEDCLKRIGVRECLTNAPVTSIPSLRARTARALSSK